MDVINFHNKLELFDEHWSPKIIAGLNDYHFKLAKIKGEFTWHSHPETDECFIVLKGWFELHLRDEVLTLSAGEMCVVPRGVSHRPVAVSECHLLLVEPAGTLNTGDTVSELTKHQDEWI
jgi:mannose-6-phosphate isomerase-like protein (cupin superfamily)